MTRVSPAFRSKELAEKLGVAAITVRKWSLKLEEKGYEIARDGEDRRLYSERDLMAFELLSKRLKEKMPLEKAVAAVADQFRVHSIPNDDIIKQLRSYIESERIWREKLVQKIEQQESFIRESLAELKRLLEENMQDRKEAIGEVQLQISVTKNS